MKRFLSRFMLVLAVAVPTLAMPVAVAAPWITSGSIANGAVTRDKIAFGAVDGARIANGTITLDKLAAINVVRANIARGAIGSDQLGVGAVRRRHIANRSVNKDKIAPKSINSRRIVDRGVRRVDLAKNSVDTNKIINGSVRSSDVRDGNLRGRDIRKNSIGGDRIRNGTLTGSDIANGSLTQADMPMAVVGRQTGLRIESGETTITTAGLGIQNRTLGFNKNFASPPLVLVSFKNVSDLVGVSNLQGSATATDISVKFKVSSSSAGTVATISWLAIGK